MLKLDNLIEEKDELRVARACYSLLGDDEPFLQEIVIYYLVTGPLLLLRFQLALLFTS